MTEMLVQPTYFPVPAITPLKGTLLDVATIHEGIGWLEPEDLMESFNCLVTDSQAVFPCPPATVAVPVQAASSTSTTGGTLAAGTYRAVVTAVNSRGETIASNEITQVTTGATSTITWNWADVSGETAYRLYVTSVGGASGTETFLVELPAGTTSYIQDGDPTPDGATSPPDTNTAIVPVNKTFNGPNWIDGIRFGVYGGVICKVPGFDMETAAAEAKRVFLAKESVGVARALMQSRFTTPAATDLTPAGGAVSPAVGLALLEGDAAIKYAGVPTIHVPRSIGTLLTRDLMIEMEGNALFSVQGSKIASDGGYESPNNSPAGVAAPAGEKWIYSSGEVALARGELIVKFDINRETDEVLVLVERLYVAAIDCLNSAVRVEVL